MNRIRLSRPGVFRAAALGTLVLATSVMLLGSTQPSSASAQATRGGTLSFSLEKTADNQPISPASSFSPPVQRIWATFDQSSVPAGAHLTRIIRYNGSDVVADSLPTATGQGRYAFAISAGSSVLAEGGWEVVVYANGAQTAIGSFEVASSTGSQSSGAKHSADSDDNDNGSDNDNS